MVIFDTWRARLKDLFDYLVKGIADPALAEPERNEKPGTANFRNAGRILIEEGKTDIVEHAAALNLALAALDECDREAAYCAVHGLIRGTLEIAGSGIIPVAALHRVSAANTEAARKMRLAKRAGAIKSRREIVRTVDAKTGGNLPIKTLVQHVNDRLTGR